MNKLNQGMAAVVLVMSLGLVMPTAFGGSASAEPTPLPDHGRWEEPRWFYCDLDRNGTATKPSFETTYQVVSQANDLGSFHVLDSSSILAYSYDLTDEKDVPFTQQEQVAAGDPDAPVATETWIFRADPNDPRQNGRGNHHGKFAQAVACHENQVETNPDGTLKNEFTSFTGEFIACCKPEDGPLVVGAHYHFYESRTWYVTVTGDGTGAVKSGGKHHHHSHHNRH